MFPGVTQSDILKIIAKDYRRIGAVHTAQKMEDEAAVYEAAEILHEEKYGKYRKAE